jgi:hypothetical protein
MSFENFEQPKKNIKPKAPEDPSRRKFFKDIILTAGGVMLGVSELKNNPTTPNTENKNIEQKEELCIVEKEVWDEKSKQILIQYEQKVGEKFKFEIKGKKYQRTVSYLSYDEQAKIENKERKDFYKRIVIHHSDMESNKSSLDQVRIIRDFHLGEERKFNDIAYHFLIGEDGVIYAGRPLGIMGSHAGYTVEGKEELKKDIGENYEKLNPNNSDYLEKLEKFKSILKKDPDYGSIGICLLGNFNLDGKISEQQKESLENLLNHLKGEYEIPKDNIIYHSEVDDKVIKPSGFRRSSVETNCPGDKFPERDDILGKLIPDSEEAKCKSILLKK